MGLAVDYANGIEKLKRIARGEPSEPLRPIEAAEIVAHIHERDAQCVQQAETLRTIAALVRTET